MTILLNDWPLRKGNIMTWKIVKIHTLYNPWEVGLRIHSFCDGKNFAGNDEKANILYSLCQIHIIFGYILLMNYMYLYYLYAFLNCIDAI